MRLRWTAPAAHDLYTITRHIKHVNPLAAREVARAIYDGCSSLERFPNRGRKGRIEGTRELVFPGLPYVAVYRIREQTIELVRIYHGAQDWP
jgi:toxin ParE1/3/4